MVSTIIRPSRDKKGYRLRCRFRIEPFPSQRRLDLEKVRVAEWFVRDMHKEGWENDNRFGFTMKGPFPMVEPVTIHVPRTPTAREMLPLVLQGARLLDPGGNAASVALTLASSDSWEYEIAGVFVRTQILTERPDAGEE